MLKVSPQLLKRKTPSRVSKQVSFNNRVQVRLHIALSEITQDERDVAWYSRRELDNIRDTCDRISNMIYSKDKRLLKQNDYYCDRGLVSQLERIKRKDCRVQITATVLHRQMINVNPVKIARSAMKQSENSVKEALRRGKIDECEAKRIHFPMSIPKRTSTSRAA